MEQAKSQHELGARPAPGGRVLKPLLAAKGVVALVMAAMILGWPSLDPLVYQNMPHWPPTGGPDWRSHLATWDVPHYLRLAQQGYVAGSPSNAFYPLWPALLRLSAPLTGGELLLAGLALGTLFSLAAFWLFHALVEETHGRALANRSLILMWLFPGALFFHVPYTESLFLLLLMVLFHSLRRNYWLGVAAAAVLLPLTKAIGIFCLAPIVWHLAAQRHSWRRYWVCLAPLAGFGLYFLCCYWATGDPWEGMRAQRFYPHHPKLANAVNVEGLWRQFWAVDSLHDFTGSGLDRLLFVCFLALLPWLWRCERTWFWFALPAGLLPALTNWFFSYTRYIMVVFPVFVVLADLLHQGRRPWLYYLYGAAGLAVQMILLYRYLNYRWAG